MSQPLLFFLALLLAALLIQYVRHRRAARNLRDSQRVLEARNRQLTEQFGRLIAAQETERTRIARDLHDDVSQRLAALSLAISGLKRKLATRDDDAEMLATVQAMQRDAAVLAQQIRHVSHDLHPGLLQPAGLVAALGEFCRQFGNSQNRAIGFSAAPGIGSVPEDAALCLYRIAQEALHNVAKHADASEINVALARDGELLQLLITDNGRGFDLMATPSNRNLGLLSMNERARLLGGQVVIETRPGAGTRLEVRLPHAVPSRTM